MQTVSYGRGKGASGSSNGESKGESNLKLESSLEKKGVRRAHPRGSTDLTRKAIEQK